MIKAEVNGSEVKDPDHEQLIIEFEKKGEFTITAKFEETHKGTWKLSDDKRKLILNDQTAKQETIMLMTDLDDSHLALRNFDNKPNKTVYFIPLNKKKAMHLNHKEYLLAKTWTVDKSEKEETIGTRFVFSVNKTFVIVPLHTNTPIASGDWEMSEDKNFITMEMKEDGQELKLEIKTLHRHELVLENKENGFIKHFVDHKLEEEEEEGVEVEADDK